MAAIVGNSGSLTNYTLGTLKTAVARGAKQSYENEIAALEQASTDLKALQGTVENRASELQNSRISIPSKEVLLKDAIGYIETFDKLYEAALKAKELAGQLKEVITYLTPKGRDYQFDQMLKERGGELGAAIEKTDTTCLERVKELGDCWGKVETLQTKMMGKFWEPMNPLQHSAFRDSVRSSIITESRLVTGLWVWINSQRLLFLKLRTCEPS